jgi:hypothetical protein
MKRFTLQIILFIILWLAWKPVAAQTSVQLTDISVTHTYGSDINFSARAQQPDDIKDIFLFLKVEGENEPRGSLILTDTSGFLNFSYNVQQTPIRPFAKISYWYSFSLKSGGTFNSQEYYFQYTDNRHPWQTLKSDSVQVNWYSGDMEFGKKAFDILHQSILRISNLISISMDDPIVLYLYETNGDLQESLGLGGLTTSGPEMQVLMVFIDPTAEFTPVMEKTLPYDLAHLLLYRETGSTYRLLPAWFREGLATQAEIAPDPNFDFALANAVEKQTLIEMSDLCTNFPQDDVSNFLAYAQSNSFTTYLINKHGSDGLEKLILSYTNGMDCEQGVKSALGKTLSQLQNDWLQATFNKNAIWQAITSFLPYLFLLFMILLIPLLNKK